MENEKLNDYYAALDRLVNNKPSKVMKGTKISLNAVAMEAGRSAGSIKKSRKLYTSLILDVKHAAEKAKITKDSRDLKISALQVELQKYKELYEESLAREVVISSRLLDYISRI